MTYTTNASGSAGGSAITSDADRAGGTNTGGGSGGSTWYDTSGDCSGGSGIVIIRVPTANYSGTTSGIPGPQITTDGSDTVMKFTGTGSYTG